MYPCKKMKKSFLFLIITILLVGCQLDSELVNEPMTIQSGLYISFTVTHAVDGSENTFESDIYCFGIEDKIVRKVTTIPYFSSYPLAVYDDNDKKVYYSRSSSSKVGERDELYQYDIETNETLRLTSSLYGINYIFSTEDTIILGAISEKNTKALGPKIYNKSNGVLQELAWNEDDFINQMTFNPLTKTTVFSVNSISEEYSAFDKANNEGVSPKGISNVIYTMQGTEYVPEFSVESGFMHNLVSNKEGIYYQQDNSIFNSTNILSKYHFNNKIMNEIPTSKISGETIYISENGNEIYYNNKNKIMVLNLETNNIETIFSVKQNKEAINNAQILNKR